MLPVKADLVILSPVTGLSGYSVAFMLSYKMDFSSCDIMPGFGKSSHTSSFRSSLQKHISQLVCIRSYIVHICNRCVGILVGKTLGWQSINDVIIITSNISICNSMGCHSIWN